MFNLVSNVIQNAVNIVSPPLAADEEFKWHCDIIKEYFTNKQNYSEINNKLIEDTQLPKHLNEIMRLLLEDNKKLFSKNLTELATNTMKNVSNTLINSNNLIDEFTSSVLTDQSNNKDNLKNDDSLSKELKNDFNSEIIISPSLEYLLSNKILEILCLASKKDHPVGICLHTYRFLTKLINEYKVNLLNHCSILNSIHELINICAINLAGPYETNQIEFLSVIVNKIKKNYNLIYCFNRDDFPLFNSLLTMLSSPDSNVSKKSGELLIDIVSLIDLEIEKIILNKTKFSSKIIDNLIYHYIQIPSNSKPEEIENIINQDENDFHDLTNFSLQMRKFLTFFKWFCFIDTLLLKCKTKNLQLNLIDCFKNEFLNKIFMKNLFLNQNIDLQVLNTILVFACLKHSKTNLLKHSIIEYLLETDYLIDLNENLFFKNQTIPLQNEIATYKLRDETEILDGNDNFNLRNVIVSLENETLKIDENVKKDEKLDDYKSQEDCKENLSNDVIKNINEEDLKKNTDESSKETNEQKLAEANNANLSKSNLNKRLVLIERCRLKVNDNIDYQFLTNLNLKIDEEKKVYDQYILSLYTLQLFEEILNKSNQNNIEKLVINNLISRSYLDYSRLNLIDDETDELMIKELNLCDNEKLVFKNSLLNNLAIKSIKYFIAVIPNELKSCESDFGFEPYITEAQKKFDDCLTICENWLWPKEINKDLMDKNDLFYESDLISMLFDNLKNIIFLPYEINLQMSSLITKLALLPHPNLNEYLLNPCLPLKDNIRSLFSILHKIVDQLQIEVLGVKNLKVKLNVTRDFLLGNSDSLRGFDISKKDQKILKALIITEEFCKELAAVSFVKNNYFN